MLFTESNCDNDSHKETGLVKITGYLEPKIHTHKITEENLGLIDWAQIVRCFECRAEELWHLPITHKHRDQNSKAIVTTHFFKECQFR